MMSGRSIPAVTSVIGTVMTWSTPSARGQNPPASRPDSASCISRSPAIGPPVTECAGLGEHIPGTPGQHNQCGMQLVLIVLRQRPHRWRIFRVDGRLQLWRVGDESRHHGQILDEGGNLLVHQRARFDEAALQFRLGLPRRGEAHEVHGRANRHDGQRGACQKNPIGERSKNGHVLSEGEIRFNRAAILGDDDGLATPGSTPSFQATRVYRPGGTRLI